MVGKLVDVATRAVRTTVWVERRSRAAAMDAAGATALALLDVGLSSRYAEEVMQRLLAGPVAERAVGVALRGPLVDAVARDIVEGPVLTTPELERLMTESFRSGRVQTALTKALDSAAAEQLVASVFDSSLLDQVVSRLLASDALSRLVEEIAVSPAVTAAITQQGFGFADQVGDEVRRRSRHADLWLERKARRAMRRPGAVAEQADQGAPSDAAS